MVRLVKLPYLKVSKYPRKLSKRKFGNMLPQVTFDPACAPRQDQITPAEKVLQSPNSGDFWKASQIIWPECLAMPRVQNSLFNPPFLPHKPFFVTFLVLGAFFYLFQDWHFCAKSCLFGAQKPNCKGGKNDNNQESD